jgi:ADP-L-glycero-D-manno-heptose 6-epimerase
MIILTGGAGFIGTNTLIRLNNKKIDDILIVDNIKDTSKWKNLIGNQFREYISKNDLWKWLRKNKQVPIDGIIHLGACSDTTETNFEYLIKNNVHYSKKLWKISAELDIPFIYASSAATYGDGSEGFSDEHETITRLKPINAYGFSKHIFDLWALKQNDKPSRWAGLKYFNVFGSYESHKGRMASVVYHAIPQVVNNKKIRLFKSHNIDFKDGEQKRDFIFVNDAVDITLHFFNEKTPSGIYNVGSGNSRTFNDLAAAIFSALSIKENIEYFDMPEDLKPIYQYYTQADLTKLLSTGYNRNFITIEKSMELLINKYD